LKAQSLAAGGEEGSLAATGKELKEVHVRDVARALLRLQQLGKN